MGGSCGDQGAASGRTVKGEFTEKVVEWRSE